MRGLLLLDQLAEARIEEAIATGAFDDLPGAGRPLELEDDRLVPEELRAAYRMLKRAGFVPPEVEARKEVSSLVTLIATLDDEPARRRALAKLAFIHARLEVRSCGFAPMRHKRTAG
jgi:DnaJ-like protein